ncbi:hypothetical protein GJ496_008891, partial [Pomphorhynchus laevis]
QNTNDDIPVFQPCPQDNVRQPSDVSLDPISSENSQADASSTSNISVEQSISDFDSILHDFHTLNDRLNSVIVSYSNVVSRSARPPYPTLSSHDQYIFSQAPIMMHLMSHIYHNISDLVFFSATAENQPYLSLVASTQDSSDSLSSSQRSPTTFGQNQNALSFIEQSSVHPSTANLSPRPPTALPNNELSSSAASVVRQYMMSAISDAINPLLSNTLINGNGAGSAWRPFTHLSHHQYSNERQPRPYYHNQSIIIQHDGNAIRNARQVNQSASPRTVMFNQPISNSQYSANGGNVVSVRIARHPITITARQNMRMDRNQSAATAPRPTLQIIRSDGSRNTIPIVTGHLAYPNYQSVHTGGNRYHYHYPMEYYSYPMFNGGAYPQYMHYPQIPMQYPAYPYPIYPFQYRAAALTSMHPYQFNPSRGSANRPSVIIRQSPPVSTNTHARQNVSANDTSRSSIHRSRQRNSATDRRPQFSPSVDPYFPCPTGGNVSSALNVENSPIPPQPFSQTEQAIADILAQVIPPLFQNSRERVINVVIGNVSQPDIGTATITTAPSSATTISGTESNEVSEPHNCHINSGSQSNDTNEHLNAVIEQPANETLLEISAIIESDIDQQQSRLNESHLNALSLSSVFNQIQHPHQYTSSDEDIFNECLQIILNSLTFGNVIQLLNGSIDGEAFDICLEKLTELLSNQNQSYPLRANYRNYFMARQLADVLLKVLYIDESLIGVSQGISLQRTLQGFVRYSMYRLICVILSKDTISVRRTNILSLLRTICTELSSLLSDILLEPQSELTRIQNGHLIFPNIPVDFVPLLQLNCKSFTQIHGTYRGQDNEISTIVEIDRLNFVHLPHIRSRSHAYQSMIPHKRRRAALLNLNEDAVELHRVVLQRVIDMINSDSYDDTRPSMRMSVLENIRDESENNLADRYPSLQNLCSSDSNKCNSLYKEDDTF